MKRIGFACHYVINDGGELRKGYESFRKPFVMKSTTRKYIQSQDPEKGFLRLTECVVNNLNAVEYLVTALSQLPKNVRMLRVSSDLFPLYTAPDDIPKEFYASAEFQKVAQERLAFIGNLARKHDVKLSFHPDQWVVLGSPYDYVVDNALAYLEYHADVIRMMGFAKEYGDFKCNIHLSGNGGLKHFLKNFYRLSPEARRVVTIENTEFGVGTLENCLQLRKHIPIVLDIHHHWVNSKGEYIKPNDARVRRVRDSWAVSDLRPTMHFSWIVENACYGMDVNRLPRYAYLRQHNTDTVLRKHAMTFYNIAARDWALGFLNNFDIMCEAKAKNVASYELFNYAVEHGYI